jgi:hypothetical protein
MSSAGFQNFGGLSTNPWRQPPEEGINASASAKSGVLPLRYRQEKVSGPDQGAGTSSLISEEAAMLCMTLNRTGTNGVRPMEPNALVAGARVTEYRGNNTGRMEAIVRVDFRGRKSSCRSFSLDF